MRPQIYGGVDRFFRWRNLFMASVALFMLIRLLFFAYDDLPAAYAPPGGGLDVKHYLQIRALGVGSVIVLYSFSYLRDWFFPQVALFFFAVAVANLTMDTFNFYVLFEDGMTKVVVITLVLRSVVIGCLFFNALNAHRAPAMPRKFWS